MNGNRTVQSASPDVGSAPVSLGQTMLGGGQSSGAQTEVMKQVLGVIEKKVRNMEKKKVNIIITHSFFFFLTSHMPLPPHEWQVTFRNNQYVKSQKHWFVDGSLIGSGADATPFHSMLKSLLQSKLDDYQAKKNKGERLNQDQLVGTPNPSPHSLCANHSTIWC